MASSRSAKQQPSNGKEKGDPPVWSRRCWVGSASLEVAVFEKEITGDSGTFTAYNLSLKRVYKADDEFKSTQGMRADDVPFAIQLLTQAYAWISEQNKR